MNDLPEDDTRPMPTRFKLGCPYCGLVGLGNQHEEVCPENPARKMSHAELIAMCEEHQRQVVERDAEIEKLRKWQREAFILMHNCEINKSEYFNLWHKLERQYHTEVEANG